MSARSGSRPSKAAHDRAQKRYRTAHPEMIKALWENWYATAKTDPAWLKRRAAQKHASYLRTKAKRIAAQQRWAEANRDRMRAANKKFRVSHPERVSAWSAASTRARVARMQGATIGKVDYAAVIRDSNGICGICKQLVLDGPVHIDHIIPIARGGSHTQDNLQLTHARCNLMKGASVMKAG